jgi:hypothetical protein
MAGLPRSGGTLLSSILNQNPDIYVSPQSALPNILSSTYGQYFSKENKDADQRKNIYWAMDSIIPNFYQGNSEKYIIDRSFSWLAPHLYMMLEQHLKNPIKILFPVRNILEILSSWNRICDNDPENNYDKEILRIDSSESTIYDKRAEYFMVMPCNCGIDHGMITAIENLKRIWLSEFQKNIMIIDYENLVSDTQSVLANTYDFLEIKKYQHRYEELETPHEYKDTWGVKNQHKVKSLISSEKYNISEIFSQDVIDKYSGLEFWKETRENL